MTFFGLTLESLTFFGVSVEYFGIFEGPNGPFVLISFRRYNGILNLNGDFGRKKCRDPLTATLPLLARRPAPKPIGREKPGGSVLRAQIPPAKNAR